MLELESGVVLVRTDLKDTGRIRRLRTGAIVSQLLRVDQIEMRLNSGGLKRSFIIESELMIRSVVWWQSK